MEPTVLIVGAGTFGTSIAYHLAKTYKDPTRVIIVDRSSSPPEPAAAIDVNRVIRTDYANPLYCNLAYEAIHDWFWAIELQAHFHMVGWLMLDEEGSDLSDRIQDAFKARGSDLTEEIAIEHLRHRFDFLKETTTEGFRRAYFNPSAGWCDAAAATSSVMEAAEERGVTRVTANVSELVLEDGRAVGIQTADGQTIMADQVVLATGAWTSSLLSSTEDALDMTEDERVERQVRATGAVAAYYRVSEGELEQLSQAQMPVVVYGQAGEVVPACSRRRLLKYSHTNGTFTNTITTRSGQKITMPVNRSQHDVPRLLRQEAEKAIISKVMPQFATDREPDYWRICWDAFTPTEDWLMCQHPSIKGVYLAVGGSFHSYKFLPIAGKYMVNILSGQGNGAEKDQAFGWKSSPDWNHPASTRIPTRELNELEDM